MTCRKAPDFSPEQGLNDLRPRRAHVRFESSSLDLFRAFTLSYLCLPLPTPSPSLRASRTHSLYNSSPLSISPDSRHVDPILQPGVLSDYGSAPFFWSGDRRRSSHYFADVKPCNHSLLGIVQSLGTSLRSVRERVQRPTSAFTLILTLGMTLHCYDAGASIIDSKRRDCRSGLNVM